MKVIPGSAVLLVGSVLGFAQSPQFGQLVEDVPTRPDLPGVTYVPATKPNLRFPLSATMRAGRFHYNLNHEYKGSGLVLVARTQYSFHYRCAYGFELGGDTYEARWVKPGEKLEILMGKPGSGKTAACQMRTTFTP